VTGRPPPPPSLVDRVRGLVHRACVVYGGGPAMPELQAAAARLDEPLRVAIAGRLKSGKSTLLNALVGQELAATDAGECTRVVTWYRDGHTYRILAHPHNGPPRPVTPGPTGAARDLGGLRPEDVDRLVVDWPSAALRSMTLIDTPGLDSLSSEPVRLAELGLLKAETENGGRRRRTFHLTETGRDELREWLAEPTPEHFQMRDIAELKLFFNEVGEPDDVVRLAREQVQAHRERIAVYEDMQKRYDEIDAVARRMVTLRLGLEMEHAALRFWSSLLEPGLDARPRVRSARSPRRSGVGREGDDEHHEGRRRGPR